MTAGTVQLRVRGIPAACAAADQTSCSARYDNASSVPFDPLTNVSAPLEGERNGMGVITLQGLLAGKIMFVVIVSFRFYGHVCCWLHGYAMCCVAYLYVHRSSATCVQRRWQHGWRRVDLHTRCAQVNAHTSATPALAGTGLLPVMHAHRPMVFLHTTPTERHPWGLVPCMMQTANNTLLRCVVGALCDQDTGGNDCPEDDVMADVLVAWCPMVGLETYEMST